MPSHANLPESNSHLLEFCPGFCLERRPALCNPRCFLSPWRKRRHPARARGRPGAEVRLWLGRSDAWLNDMLGIAQRHRGDWRVALVPPTQPPPQSQKGGKATGHSLQKYPRCLSCSTSRTLNSSRSPRSSVERAASWRAAGMAAGSRLPPGRASHFCPRSPLPKYYSKTQASESPQFEGLRSPSSNVSPGPRRPSPPFQELRHPGPLSFCSVN